MSMFRLGAPRFARPPARAADFGFPRADPPVTTLVLLILLAVATAAVGLAMLRRSTRRQRAVRQLLDAADALESRLRTARAEIEAVAGDEDDPVRDALREMLRQRLWLQQHGGSASLEELAIVRASIDAARLRIDQQLVRIERARAPLA
jgi:hypothetical protein